MRIAVIAGRFPLLSETFVLAHVTALIARGHEVTVLASPPPADAPAHEEFARQGLRRITRYWGNGRDVLRAMRREPRQPWRLLRCLDPRLPRSLRKKAATAAAAGPFDVLLCHFGHVGLEALELQRIGALRGKLVTVFHAYDLTVFPRARGEGVYRELFEAGALFLPISTHARQRLLELGCEASRIAVLHMGIDCDHFAFEPRRVPADGVVRLLSVARLTEKKGLEHALEAVAKLTEKGFSLRYEIAGDGPLRAALQRRIDAFGLGERVTLLGPQPHERVAQLLSKAQILLAPSVTAENGDMEGIPVGIMEAMATGMPVVSTRHSGIPELIDHGREGLLTTERDSSDLAEAIGELLSSPERWPQMGGAARRKVERHFNRARLDAELERLLSSA